jgi:putative spermidine/putrescine transport system ATP-binding protein
MHDAKIVQVGTPREVFNAPANEFVARFMGGHNIVQRNGKSFAVRADRITVQAKKPAAKSNAVAGTISEIEYQGTAFHVTMTNQDGENLTVQLAENTFDQNPLEVGANVYATWEPASAHALG